MDTGIAWAAADEVSIADGAAVADTTRAGAIIVAINANFAGIAFIDPLPR